MSDPKEPPISCPHLDSAIEEIETARKIHSDLRDWGNYWKDKFHELEKDSSNEIDRLKEEIKTLEDELHDAKVEINQYERST